jgi:arylsulfatase A-like enzyme
MPTLAEVAGAKVPSNIDGISFLPSLLDQSGQKQHEYMYWEFHEQGGRQAVRKGNWKLVCSQVLKPDKTTTELFDLSRDLGEANDVAGEHPEVVKELLILMKNARVEVEAFPFGKK